VIGPHSVDILFHAAHTAGIDRVDRIKSWRRAASFECAAHAVDAYRIVSKQANI